jgi:Leucine-rich repeat (LRR) protein
VDLSDVPLDYRRRIDGKKADFTRQSWTELPDWITNLTKPTVLDLGGNRLTWLPSWIGDLISLTDLYLQGNQITRLPDVIRKLSALYLGNNELWELPDGLTCRPSTPHTC